MTARESNETRTGLSSAEAARRLVADGPNEIPSQARRGAWPVLLSIVREPMLALLGACTGLYFVLGDAVEAFVLAGSAVAIVAINFYQQRKTDRAVEALRALASPRALVIRGGARLRVPGREVVRGDLLVLEEGDRVAADAAVLSAEGLMADESLLTGESVPVAKAVWDGAAQKPRPGGEGLSFVYSGTMIVRGHALARVESTGLSTAMGAIGKSLARIETETTALHRETGRIVRLFGGFALLACLAVAVLYGLSRGDWVRGGLAGLTLAMSLIPEEFPVVLTIFLALGAWRMSRQKVLVRRAHAIEALGSATVLCVDKTGTLTQNRMAAAAMPRETLLWACRASRPEAADPMDAALFEAARAASLKPEEGLALLRDYPVSSSLWAASRAWAGPEGRVAAVKGAPEAVLGLCRLEEHARRRVLKDAEAMAKDGLRVLAVAKASAGERLPASADGFSCDFVGLAGFSDPLRPAAPAAVDECRRAGIRVVMITGDHAATAAAIAARLGLKRSEAVLGAELSGLGTEALKRRLEERDVFARVRPEEKLLIVRGLKEAGEVVAMTGDGVNDAPALKAAHIGVAMGGRGTDVAREAADLVILDDDFSSIVAAVRLGRRIFDNIRKAMSYLMAVHVPIALISMIPLVLGGPLVLLPVHIVFLELIIDPACSLVFEEDDEAEGLMDKPPRRPGEPLFSRPMWELSLLQGLTAAAATLGVYLWAAYLGWEEGRLRAAAFASVVASNLALIVTNLSRTRGLWRTLTTPHRALWGVVLGTLGAFAAVLVLPGLRGIFGFAPLGAEGAGLAFAAAALTLAVLEAEKRLSR